VLVYKRPTSTQSKSTPTTFPANPRIDGVQVETWIDFGQEVRQFMAEQVSSVTTEPSEVYEFASRGQQVADMNLIYSHESRVQSSFEKFYETVVKRANLLIFGQKIEMLSPQETSLHPNFEIFLSKGSTQIALAVIEVKSPKAFPIEGNLVERFHEEQLSLKPNPSIFRALRPTDRQKKALEDKVFINQSQDTKVSQAICQLWGYMTVNHLRYGVLTTYNETFFLKRGFREDNGLSKLEISQSVRIGDQQTPIVGALCYFTSLLLESHLYSSPYSTPTLPRKNPSLTSKYDIENVNLADFHFSIPTDFKAQHVLKGQYRQNKPTLLKIMDSTKNGAELMFLTELRAYEKLDELQGNGIPILEQSYLMSSFLYVFALEDCGNPITPSQLPEVYQNVVGALKKIHSKGVLHGDIALRNILINSSGNEIVFIDFGLAKFYGSQEEENAGLSFVSSESEWEELCVNELLQLKKLL
jgi:tRNA A-37 threonylcarbamoyl transferase component Bud32